MIHAQALRYCKTEDTGCKSGPTAELLERMIEEELQFSRCGFGERGQVRPTLRAG